jgi:hypothetical protein
MPFDKLDKFLKSINGLPDFKKVEKVRIQIPFDGGYCYIIAHVTSIQYSEETGLLMYISVDKNEALGRIIDHLYLNDKFPEQPKWRIHSHDVLLGSNTYSQNCDVEFI